jgi:hypothetical protein
MTLLKNLPRAEKRMKNFTDGFFTRGKRGNLFANNFE